MNSVETYDNAPNVSDILREYKRLHPLQIKVWRGPSPAVPLSLCPCIRGVAIHVQNVGVYIDSGRILSTFRSDWTKWQRQKWYGQNDMDTGPD